MQVGIFICLFIFVIAVLNDYVIVASLIVIAIRNSINCAALVTVISPIRTVIVSHMDVCKNKFTYHLSDKTHGFGWRFIHSGGASSVILRTRERAAHVTSHMIVCCK